MHQYSTFMPNNKTFFLPSRTSYTKLRKFLKTIVSNDAENFFTDLKSFELLPEEQKHNTREVEGHLIKLSVFAQ